MTEKASVLIVEDEAIVAKTIERRLESLGYSISGIASTGIEAVDLAKKKKPDLVLMDIGLPGKMDGIEAAQEIKDRFGIPVIYLTAYGDETTLRRAQVTEPFGYLMKPFEAGDLYRTIEVAIYKSGMERELRESEERFRAIFENSHTLITLSDLSGLVMWANPAWLEKTGYTPETQGDIVDKVHPDDLKRFIKIHEELKKKDCDLMRWEYRYKSVDGDYLWLDAMAKKIKLRGEDMLSVISNDVTRKKITELEMKMKLMKFSLEEGSLYLVQEPSVNLAKEAFGDLLKVGYNGIMLSRTPKEKTYGLKDYEFRHIWISEKGKGDVVKPKVKAIEGLLDTLPANQAILIDRLDYIISKNDFKSTLHLVQSLNELAYLKNQIIILSTDPKVMKSTELAQLEKESTEVEPFYKGKLPHDVVTLLKAVYDSNIMGVKPTYSKIGDELKISKPTCRKRVRKLITAGYLFENTTGRSKVLELTGKGRILFEK